MNNNDLIFVTKDANGKKPEDIIDISLTLVDARKTVALSLSRKAITMMGNSTYIVCAQSGGRLYIKTATSRDGYKISIRDNSTRGTVRVPAAPLGIDSRWIGYYYLLWDKMRDLFYINVDMQEGAK